MSKTSTQKKFIYIAAIFGILFVILTPPFQGADEDSHFKKAYVLAQGNFFPDTKDGKKGYNLPAEMTDYISSQLEMAGNLNKKVDFGEINKKVFADGMHDKHRFERFSTASANPIVHVVPAIGILVGRIIGIISRGSTSYVCLLYFARIANLIAYIVMVSLAIRLTPVLKETFCMLGLLPMTLFLASTMSYDMLLNGGSFLFAAMCFRLLYSKEQKISRSSLVIFGVILFLFYTLKIVYLPLFVFFVALLVRRAPEDGWKQVIKYIAVTLSVCVAMVFITSVLPGFLEKEVIVAASGGGVSTKQLQLQFILSHPIEYLKIFFHTIKSYSNFYISSTIGIFGWLDTWLFPAFVYPYLFYVIIAGISEAGLDNISVKWYDRAIILISAAASFFGIYLAMYIYWTPVVSCVGASVIEGVQGRYFLPIFPMLFLVFGNTRVRKHKIINVISGTIVEYGSLVSILVLIVSASTILLRFWV